MRVYYGCVEYDASIITRDIDVVVGVGGIGGGGVGMQYDDAGDADVDDEVIGCSSGIVVGCYYVGVCCCLRCLLWCCYL